MSSPSMDRRFRSAICSVLLVAAASLSSLQDVSAADLPRPPLLFDTTYAAPTGNVIRVAAGGSFQAALDSAQLGDVIELQAGATFRGPFVLPAKSGTGWIHIRSSALESLPPAGTRVRPSDAANMPKIVVGSSVGAAIQTVARSRNYRFVGVEIHPVPGNYVSTLVRIGNDDTSASTLPSNIVFDRCYIHGDASIGARRGVAMDGAYVAVVDSYLSDFKEDGADTQAVWAFNTTGPLKIVNNYLEAAGENIMFGGADSRAEALVPADIEIRGNLIYKPLSWVGSIWSVKNLIEFKAAKRVLVSGNRFENVWPAAQVGWAMLVSPRNQDGSAPWSVTEDIALERNVWINVAQGLRVGGADDNNPSLRTSRVLIRDNLIEVTGIGDASGRLFQILGGPTHVTIDHNTGFVAGTDPATMFAESVPRADNFVFTNNLVERGEYGFRGTGSGDGLNTLNTHFSNWTFSRNAIIGGSSANYPANNFFPSSIAAVGFVDAQNRDYALRSTSPYKNAATDGRDIGVDFGLVRHLLDPGTAPKVPSAPARVRTR